MANNKILKTKLADPAIAVLADETARMVALNNKDIQVKIGIDVDNIRRYLVSVNKLMAIESSPDISAKRGVRMLELFNPIDVTNPVFETQLDNVLTDMIAANLINSTDKTIILGMGDTMNSWADQNWSGDVTLTDIQNARDYT